ncbi:hemolysin [Leifsonia xyli subsp. cynodontis DSM 46306]|uniref:Uncharacterized protein n=1 Tax=Leifsonia xyli subsp. cynodontis DSM 46306 TaxID=1389489 RepID=U3P891_LEIXC|nr:hemolysin [Leifsonia xyli subsp. cynodontis DSM 46306]
MRYAVVTQACCLRPCRSSPMVRMAVSTTVWSRAEKNMPAMSPKITKRICRWVMIGLGAALAVGAWLDMGPRVESRESRRPAMRPSRRRGEQIFLRRLQSYTQCDYFGNASRPHAALFAKSERG